MRHLVGIYDNVKKISATKKKMTNDPLNAKKHEREMWLYYNKVTEHKEAYYHEK